MPHLQRRTLLKLRWLPAHEAPIPLYHYHLCCISGLLIYILLFALNNCLRAGIKPLHFGIFAIQSGMHTWITS